MHEVCPGWHRSMDYDTVVKVIQSMRVLNYHQYEYRNVSIRKDPGPPATLVN
jgi:hypothetical protein